MRLEFLKTLIDKWSIICIQSFPPIGEFFYFRPIESSRVRSNPGQTELDSIGNFKKRAAGWARLGNIPYRNTDSGARDDIKRWSFASADDLHLQPATGSEEKSNVTQQVSVSPPHSGTVVKINFSGEDLNYFLKK